jgi:hypothetical protein
MPYKKLGENQSAIPVRHKIPIGVILASVTRVVIKPSACPSL